MENLYLNLFYIFIVIGSLLFVASVFIFFYLNIPKVIGDLTGKTSQKAIQKSRELNKNSGVKQYKPSSVNAQRGKITDRIDDTSSQSNGILYGDIKTDPIGTAPNTTVLETVSQTPTTTVLATESAGVTTTVLANNSPSQATTVLSDSIPTMEPGLEEALSQTEPNLSEFVIEEDQSYSESSEIIV